MADRGGFLSDTDRAVLSSFPATIDTDDLIRCFTLSDEDLDYAGRRRGGPGSRLAAGLQIGAYRLLGFAPKDLSTAPEEIVGLVASQTGASPADLVRYEVDARTRAKNLRKIEAALGFSRVTAGDRKALKDWLLDRAMEHDNQMVLLRLTCNHLAAQRLVRPGLTRLERSVIAARQQATTETYLRIADQLPAERRDLLDQMLDFDAELGYSPLVWLRQEAPSATGAAIRAQLDKIDFLRSAGAEEVSLDRLNPNRVRHLNALGKRQTIRGLRRAEPERRYQILAATVVGGLKERTDEVIGLFDLALAEAERNARHDLDELIKANAREANETVGLFNQIASVVLDKEVPDSQVRRRILDRVSREQLRQAVEAAALIHRPDTGHLDLFCNRYNSIRRFSPAFVEAFTFEAADPDSPLLEAVDHLAVLNQKRRSKTLDPEETPTGFAPKRWLRHMTNSDGTISRRAWEMCVLSELRGALRGANVWVTHSNRYQNPTRYLVDNDTWTRLRPDHTDETGIDLDPQVRLEELATQLNTEIELFNEAVDGEGLVRIENDAVIVEPVPSEHPDPDPLLEQLKSQIDQLMPQIEIADLLNEVNHMVPYLDDLTHIDNSNHRAPDHTARLLATIVAAACNIGHHKMARASDVTVEAMKWATSLYIRPETLRIANARIVDYLIEQPLTDHWGNGTLSSSDGQRFPVIGRHPIARSNPRYFKRKGITVYTWTSDRYVQYGTRTIPTTAREATYVLDAIFDNETDLPIEEHTTDTAGYTDLIFGLFDLTGLKFSPRIRDVANQRFWHQPETTVSGHSQALKWAPIRTDRIVARWEDMLRVAATIRHGHLPASVLVSRLQASARQNELAQAIQDYGRLCNTISSLEYLRDRTHRQRITNMLNKGETFHALRADIRFANQNRQQANTTDGLEIHGECLTLVTNAIALWNTIHTQHAINQINATNNAPVPPELVARLSNTRHHHTNFIGRYTFQHLDPSHNRNA